jgi:hypothetical protein
LTVQPLLGFGSHVTFDDQLTNVESDAGVAVNVTLPFDVYVGGVQFCVQSKAF